MAGIVLRPTPIPIKHIYVYYKTFLYKSVSKQKEPIN